MLQARNLVLKRQGRALNTPVNLSLAAGELVWLRGENGIGKSTFLKVVLGMMPVHSGEISWQAKKPSLFYLGHELAIRPQLTVAEQCRWHPAVTASSDAEITNALTAVQLEARKDTLCSQLSRGQQQRLSLACAILSKATLWLLDEPLTALDTQSQEVIKTVLQQHQASGGALLIASHNCLASIASKDVTLEAA
jgi:heme exporter protein A